MKYLIEEFGGNSDCVLGADSVEQAMAELFPDQKVTVDSDGYVIVDGKPLGYLKVME